MIWYKFYGICCKYVNSFFIYLSKLTRFFKMIFVTIVFTSMCSADSRQIFSVPSAMISRFHPKCLIVSSMNVSISIYGVETRTNVEKRVLSDSNFSAHPKLIIGRFHLLARWPAASQTSSHTGPAAKKGWCN